MQAVRTPLGAFQQVSSCPRCEGAGQVFVPCEKCGGDGRIRENKRISLKVPAGTACMLMYIAWLDLPLLFPANGLWGVPAANFEGSTSLNFL